MEALLRELHEGPDGIPEYRDTEISDADLTIGSAADQRIQLLDRAVAPEHAVIRKSGSSSSSVVAVASVYASMANRAARQSWRSATSSNWRAIS